jgi:hypothetical protein
VKPAETPKPETKKEEPKPIEKKEDPKPAEKKDDANGDFSIVTDKLVAPDDTKAVTPSAPVSEASVPASNTTTKAAESSKANESKKDDTK